MATAASKRGVLEGAAAIELRAIDPSTAADYLCRVQLDPPPQGWHDLIDRIREQSGPLAHALDNPLTLTLSETPTGQAMMSASWWSSATPRSGEYPATASL